MYQGRLGLGLCAALSVGAGCFLISGNVGTIVFQIPKKSYSIDTADSQRWKLPPGGVPVIACGAGTSVTDCCMPPAPAAAIDCATYPMSCEAASCTLSMKMELTQPIDLGMEAPELRSIEGQRIASVTLRTVRYDIDNRTNVEMPPIDIYFAPSGVTTSSNPGAKKMGTIPRTPAGMRAIGDVALASDAKAVFREFAREFATPFNIITATTVKLKGGVTPTGKADIVVDGEAQVELTAAAASR